MRHLEGMTTTSSQGLPYTAHDVRRVAVAASVDPRTVRRYLTGQTTASTTAQRIRAALANLGFEVEPPTGAA